MKLNTRTLAFVSAFVGLGALAGSASASIRFYLAYGDAQLVKLAKSTQFGGGARDAAAALGAPIPTDRAMRIPKIADNLAFTVDVHVVVDSVTGTSAGGNMKWNSGGAFVGIDSATTGATNYADLAAFTAAADKKKLTVGGADVAASLSNLGTLPGVNASGTTDVTVTYQGSPFLSGMFGAGTTNRSIGAGFAYVFGTGNSAQIPVAADYRLFSMSIKNATLANFDVFGDASDENGISLNGVNNSTSRSNFVVSGTGAKADGYPTGSPKYAVEAVPEPGSMLAIAAGVLALAARRRK